jgi:hypothetical protein
VKRTFIYTFIFFLPFLALQHSTANAQGKQAKVVCVAFYNLENLFDTIDDPKIDDAEFLPNGSGQWDTKKYLLKLNHLATVISQIGDEYTKNGPALVGVSEVENRQVVDDLVHTPPLKSMGYDFVHFDSHDYRGIDVALLYQPKIFQVKSTSMHPLVMADTGFHTRDILQVDGLLDGELVHVLVNHWPSRSSGEIETLAKRNAAADNCLNVVKAIYKDEPGARIIIMGDLNDDPVDESLMKHLKTKTKPENLGPEDLYNPMWQMYRDGIGSLAYRDVWNLFDQIIISSALVDKKSGGYRFLKAKIFNKEFLIQKEGQYAGYPFRTYGGGIYQGGYSDHLPAYMFLVKEIK